MEISIWRHLIVEPAFHVAIPVLVALAIGVKTKKALLLSPLALLPDLDIFFTTHRLSHSFVLFAVLVVPAYLTLKKAYPNHIQMFLLGAGYTLSHILIDLFSSPCALFYPITSQGYEISFAISIMNHSPIETAIKFGLQTGQVEDVILPTPLLTGEGMIALAMLVIAIIVKQKFECRDHVRL